MAYPNDSGALWAVGYSMVKRSLAATALLLVAACTNPWAEDRLSEAERVRDGWYELSPKPALEARYCYRTLARVDCFDRPLDDEMNRQVGSFHMLAVDAN